MSRDRYGEDLSLFESTSVGDEFGEDPDLTPTDAGPSRVDQLRAVLRAAADRASAPKVDEVAR
jgi:hypothetical protein